MTFLGWTFFAAFRWAFLRAFHVANVKALDRYAQIPPKYIYHDMAAPFLKCGHVRSL